jgi:altronate dehydratase
LSRAVLLHPGDDVAVLVEPAAAGEAVEIVGGSASLASAVALPLGHKIAVRALAAGTAVRKHGEVIGRMTAAAAPGGHVHVHNLASTRA